MEPTSSAPWFSRDRLSVSPSLMSMIVPNFTSISKLYSLDFRQFFLYFVKKEKDDKAQISFFFFYYYYALSGTFFKEVLVHTVFILFYF